MQNGSTKPENQEAFLEEETHELSLKEYNSQPGKWGENWSREQKPCAKTAGWMRV